MATIKIHTLNATIVRAIPEVNNQTDLDGLASEFLGMFIKADHVNIVLPDGTRIIGATSAMVIELAL